MREAQSNATYAKLNSSQLEKWMKSCNGRFILLISPALAHWNNLDSHVRLDVETTLESLSGVRQIQFDQRYVSKPPFGSHYPVSMAANSSGVCMFLRF